MLRSTSFSALFVLCCTVSPVVATDLSAADYSKEAFVLEQSSDKFKFENDGSYTREIRTRTRIQSDAGVEHFSVIRFAFQKSVETFEIDYVRVVKPDGTVVVTSPDTYQDMPADISRQAPLYSDAHEVQVAVKGLGVGDVLEYQVQWKHDKPLVPGQFWLEYGFARTGIVLEEKLEVSVPHGRELKLKTDRIKPTVSQSGGYDIYSWSNANLANKDDKKEKQEQQQEVWQQVRGRQPASEIQLSTFQSWEEVAKWYAALQRERVQPTAEIRAKAAELTRGAPDQNARIQALYDFVSTKYRYIGIEFGIGRYQPHAAAEVLANQYGDCKDKHTLFASLLDAAGIKAYPALISSTHDIDSDIPSPGQFNHVITAVQRGTGLLWLDTTAEVAPFGVLMPSLRDKHALVISDSAPAALAATPADNPFPTAEKFKMEAKLSDTGVLEGKAESTDRGDSEVMFRAVFRVVPLPRWKDLVQQVSNNLGFGGDVSGVEASPPEKTADAFHFSYSYKRKDYSDWGNRRITPPLPTMTLPALDDDIAPIAPIWLGSPGEIDFQATLELPKGYTPDLPKAVHLKRDFADYDATYSFSSGVITAVRHLTIKLREIPAGEYKDYKSFRKAVEDDYGTYTSLSVGSSSAVSMASYQDEIWNLPYSNNTDAARLYDDARAAFQRNDIQGEIAALKRAVELDPQFIRAWLWLGDIYKFNRQTDLALQAYRKAIEIDPEQPVSYKALGFTLIQVERAEESLPVWQQLIKLTPKNTNAYFGLSSALLQLKRYEDAIPVLESALQLSPDEPSFYEVLGFACLSANKLEKARTALEALENLNPPPGILNYVAYWLADKNADLDLAKKYSEKAVQAEEESSLKLDISVVNAEDTHARTLASFWDTLGWVYFRLNDLAHSEKYLAAAWQLSQSPDIGQHIGKLYERQGKRNAAMHMYQLAHSAAPLNSSLVPGPPFIFSWDSRKNAETSIDKDLLRLGAKPDPASAVTELNKMRTFELPRIVGGTANAIFIVLLGPDKKVEARFAGGADSLKGAEKMLVRKDFKFSFPDDNPTRIARTGMLGCYPYSGCSIVFLTPSTFSPIPTLNRSAAPMVSSKPD
jgi:tetratricopeptide (TPR) repeat protein